jgi:hopene-associated glycosyltransferase HpnB
MAGILAATCFGLWIYLICARGRFWMCPVRDDAVNTPLDHWPAVTAVIPARNEVETIAASVQSLLRQTYPGRLAIVVVDDDSSDGTAAEARRAASGFANDRPLTVVTGRTPPAVWTGKLWALKQGIAAAEGKGPRPDYFLLTDADIAHAPDSLAWLVTNSVRSGFVLTSLMAKLRCQSLAERSHVAAFVYFFQMLFPFTWVCRAEARTAAAAGGCMLVDAVALRLAGGIESVRNALIDDCSLARRLKQCGPIWLGLTDRVRSLRPYARFADVRQMISRSAYAQLRFSPLILAGTIAGMALTFLVAPLFALFATGWSQGLGLAAWLAMAISFQPTLRFYRLSPLWGLALPAIAFLFTLYTLDSAYQHWRGRGGRWKGRVHLGAARLR